MPADLEIATPRVFLPLLEPARYKGIKGGRGSGKSDFFAGLLVEMHIANPGMRSVCVREVQKSLQQSVKAEIEDKIKRYGVSHLFRIMDKQIDCPGGGVILFMGMQDHTAEAVKSLTGCRVVWCEEAQSLSKHSLRVLRPTIRLNGSELWFSWNPANPEDPVDKFFTGADPEDPDVILVTANWFDNPYFPEVLELERQRDLRDRPDEYDHIWEGAYRTIADAQIYRGKFTVKDFETPDDARYYFGADFGYAKDPSTLLRCWISEDATGKDLFIDYEASGFGVELDDLATLYDTVPGSRKWRINADCSAPATISHIKRRGFNIVGADKWSGSIEEGVTFIRSFRHIYIHPRCAGTAKEFRLYSYKVDKHTGEVLPVIADEMNHFQDALRYALVGLIKGRAPMKISSAALARARG